MTTTPEPAPVSTAKSHAIISPCGTYRYTLHRRIPQVIRWVKPCLFIMLNPSYADAVRNDPTARRCIGFAESWGCTSLTIVNLFAYIATDPADLQGEFQMGTDIRGPDNHAHFEKQFLEHRIGVVVAAWGANPITDLASDLKQEIEAAGVQCLGMTKDGSPKHPLYLKGDTPLIPWRANP